MKNLVVLLGTLCVFMGIAVGQTPAQSHYQYLFQNPKLSTLKKQWVAEYDTVDLMVGASSADVKVQKTIRVNHAGI